MESPSDLAARITRVYAQAGVRLMVNAASLAHLLGTDRETIKTAMAGLVQGGQFEVSRHFPDQWQPAIGFVYDGAEEVAAARLERREVKKAETRARNAAAKERRKAIKAAFKRGAIERAAKYRAEREEVARRHAEREILAMDTMRAAKKARKEAEREHNRLVRAQWLVKTAEEARQARTAIKAAKVAERSSLSEVRRLAKLERRMAASADAERVRDVGYKNRGIVPPAPVVVASPPAPAPPAAAPDPWAIIRARHYRRPAYLGSDFAAATDKMMRGR